MNQITVTKKNGTTFNLFDKSVPRTVESARQEVELLGRDVVLMTVKSAQPMTFDLGDKITIIGRDYTLNLPPRERKAGNRLYYYDLEFEGMQYELSRAAYSVNVNTTTSEIQDISGDSLTGDIKLFLDVLVANANRVFGAGKWSVGTYPANTEAKTLTFGESDNCLNAIQTLCSEDNYNTEFWITPGAGGARVLNVGASGSLFGYTFEYGKDNGIYELIRERIAQSNIITRLNAYGSMKNIVTSKYKLGDGTFRGTRLCLPTKKKGTSYIEDSAAISKFGVWEATKFFDDIYPHRTGTVSDYGEDHLKFIDSSMDFDLNELEADGVTTKYLIAGTSAKVNFVTGNLAGYEFEIEKYDDANKEFTIIDFQDENGYKFPSATSAAFQVKPGDKYVITDIYLPASYITAAENELSAAALAYLNKYKNPQVRYSLTLDPMHLKTLTGGGASSNIFWVGDYIPIVDTAMNVDATIRLKSFSRDLIDEYKYQLTIADLPVTVNTITKVVNELKQIDTIVKINNLGDPARARRNYKVTQEVITMIETLEVEAALIGNDPAAQFELVGVTLIANYMGNASAFYASGGTINHNYYPEGEPASWAISSGSFGSLVAGTPYFLYIKATKGGPGAIYVLSATKIGVESVTGFYHFPVGVLSSVVNSVRVFTSTKGNTLITGDSIKTGKIQSAAVPDMYIDLATGEIRGNFKFTTGETVQEYIGEEINGIQIGGRNYFSYENLPAPALNFVEIPTKAAMENLVGKTATVSFDLKTSIAASILVYHYQDSGICIEFDSFNVSSTTSFQRVIATGVVVSNAVPSGYSQGSIGLFHTVGGATITVDRVMIELGNKASDWTESIDDINDDISAFDYLKTALEGSTDISGGLLATNVLLMKTLAGIITGGMSGLSSDNIGMWTGGTYQQAIDSIAKVIFRKDGSGQLAGGKIFWDLLGKLNVGNFEIVNGAIVGYDTNGAERVRFSVEDIPAISSMANNYVTASAEFTGSGAFTASSLWDSDGGFWYTQITGGNTSITIQRTVVIPYATQLKVTNPTVPITGGAISNQIATKSVVVKNSSGVTVASGNVDTNFTISSPGTYTVYFTIDISVTVDDGFEGAYVEYSAYNSYAMYIESVEKTFVGKDGLLSYFSSSEYIHFKKTQGLKVKGATDIPGILASATVASTGGSSNQWGAKVGSSAKSSGSPNTGKYTINHSIGHTNYTFIANANQYDRHVIYVTKGTTSVTVEVRNGAGSLVDQQFDYMIIGSN